MSFFSSSSAGYTARRRALIFARFAMAFVYGWFGALKLLGASPAHPMVAALAERIALPGHIEWSMVLGVFEVGLGLLFLVPGLITLAFWLMVMHLILTMLPLFFLPDLTWERFLVPTMEGQYILKNILLLALGLVLLTRRKRR